MGFCKKCGSGLEDGTQICPTCGAYVVAAPNESDPKKDGRSLGWQGHKRTGSPAAQFDSRDIADNKVMAVLAYFGLLVLVPLFAAKDSSFARYHANQGLVLLLVEFAYSFMCSIVTNVLLAISWQLYFITGIISLSCLVFPVLAVFGIINAVNGQAKELPVIGKIKLLK